jgi:hypothetical protein
MGAKPDRFEIRNAEMLGEPESEQLQALAAYWREKCAGRFAPRRADIDPLDLRAHMPYLFLVDVLPNDEFRYRLMGTAIVEGTGRDITGKWLSELHGGTPDVMQRLKSRFDQVLATRRPVFTRGQVYWLGDGEFRRFECGYFPLSEDGQAINMILAELFLFWRKRG